MQIMTIQMLFIGTTELLLIGGMALLLFGGKKLPEMMRGLGQGVKEFKKGMNDLKEPQNETDNNEQIVKAEKQPEEECAENEVEEKKHD